MIGGPTCPAGRPPCAILARAVARYLVDGCVARLTAGSFPSGTLVVNLGGAFVLGRLFATATERAVIGPDLRRTLVIGFLVAHTTFSTLMLEPRQPTESGPWALGLANAVGSVALGVVAVGAGLTIGRAI